MFLLYLDSGLGQSSQFNSHSDPILALQSLHILAQLDYYASDIEVTLVLKWTDIPYKVSR